MSNELDKMNEVASNLDCPACLRTAMEEYSKFPDHKNWLMLNDVYCNICPCAKQCGKCNILREIVRHVLTTK